MLSKWISKLVDRDALPPTVKIIAKDHLEMRIVEETRGCGHPGYMVQLWVHATDSCDWLPIGIVDDLDLPLVIELLQDATAFIDERTGLRRLPIVPLWGKRYFADGRLSELRNVESTCDRVNLVQVN